MKYKKLKHVWLVTAIDKPYSEDGQHEYVERPVLAHTSRDSARFARNFLASNGRVGSIYRVRKAYVSEEKV